jgi:hypothetical protein
MDKREFWEYILETLVGNIEYDDFGTVTSIDYKDNSITIVLDVNRTFTVTINVEEKERE